MMPLKSLVYLCCIGFILIGCSSTQNQNFVSKDPDILYKSSVKNIEQSSFKSAVQDLSNIEKEHPAYVLLPHVTMLKAYAYYKIEQFDDVVLTSDDFIKKFPAHPNIDYIYYIRAMSFAKQILDFERDQKITEDSLRALDMFLIRFPDSRYYSQIKYTRDIVYNTLAAKEMSIGRFYLKKNNIISAIPRFHNILKSYSNSVFMPEALYRIVECYVALGVFKEVQNYNTALEKTYPDSHWHSLSQQLLMQYTTK